MLWHIVRKELLVNLLSLRFLIGMVVCVLTMGLVGYALVQDFVARQQTYLSDVDQHRQELANVKVYSRLQIQVDIPPSPLSVFSKGNRELPTSVRVSPYHIPSLMDAEATSTRINLMGGSTMPHNPLLRVFASIDLSFVVGSILSLFALLLVFDSFSGEHELGTLKVMLSNSVSRALLLAGKFLGALISAVIPLTLGFLLVFLIWNMLADVSLDASSWIGAGLTYGVSVVYLAAFIAIGLLVSLFAKESSSALMFLLVVWVVVVVVIPVGGGYLAEYFRPVQVRERVARDEQQARDEMRNALSALQYRQKSEWNNASFSDFGGESIVGLSAEEIQNRIDYNAKAFPLKFRFAEESWRIEDSYAQALDAWYRTREAVICPSLNVLYRNIVESIAGNDLDSYRDKLHRAQLYRDEVMNYLRPKVASAAWFTRALEYPDVLVSEENRNRLQMLVDTQGESAVERLLSWDRVTPLDLRSMPLPAIAAPGIADRLQKRLNDLILLLTSVALFIGLSVARVARYPLR